MGRGQGIVAVHSVSSLVHLSDYMFFFSGEHINVDVSRDV